MVFDFESACAVFPGYDRENNEDNFCFNKKHLAVQNNGTKKNLEFSSSTGDIQFFAVFDGLGGESCGEKAACRASEIFINELNKLDELAISGKEFFISACDTANRGIRAVASDENVNSVGTTVAALLLSDDEAVACNVGDSRIYRIRERQMMMISEDHTDERILTAMGISKKPVLLQYLGMSEKEIGIEPYITKGKMLSGDIFVICSDGVSDVLSADEIYNSVADKSASEAVTEIIRNVEINCGSDNATVIVIKIK